MEINIVEMLDEKLILNAPAKTVECDDGTKTLGMSVYQHCCLAGEVLKILIGRIRMTDKADCLPDSVAVLAALHDIGKLSPVFIRKIISGTESGQGAEEWQRLTEDYKNIAETYYHTGIGYSVLRAMGAPKDCCRVVAEHHGRDFTLIDPGAGAKIFGGDLWGNSRFFLAEKILSHIGLDKQFPKKPSAVSSRKTLFEAWKGLVILSDWIASSETRSFRDKTEADKAKELVEQAGFYEQPLPQIRSFEDVFGFSPRPPQRLLADSYKGPGVYVLEAPTGCGKTEAALALAFEALRRGDASGLYFALPTQLTSNAAYVRVEQALERFYGEQAPVALIHGGARLQRMRLGEGGAAGGLWHQSSRLAMIAPYGVGTVDQALLGIIPAARFHQLRLAGLFGKVLIIDEVHSYDDYTLTLIKTLIGAVEAMKGTVIILSATLTHRGLKELLGAEASPSEAPIALTVRSGGGITKQELTARDAEAHPVHARLLESEDAEELAYAEAVRRASEGMQVLWIENTVKAAQKVHEKLRGSGVQAGLLHSRFRAMDREENEKAWTALYGKNGGAERAKAGHILIGTQVLEQSLDLDADFLITRLAPMDLLVQRAGRLWRHGSTVRPASCQKPEAWILAVPESTSSGSLDDQPFGASGAVYHPYILHRTLSALRERLAAGECLNFPEEVREMLEAAFGDREETESDLAAGWKQDLSEKVNSMRQHAAGTVSAAHGADEAAAEAMTRLIARQTFDTAVITPNDLDVLRSCTDREELCYELERRIVKAAKPYGQPGSLALLECIPDALRGWADRAERFKRIRFCKADQDGMLQTLDGEDLMQGGKVRYTGSRGLEEMEI